MNLKSLSIEELNSRIKTLVQDERKITVEILWHLREIERRSAFADFGYTSLWDYVIRELGYSEGSAGRRISAMRLLKDLPEAEESLLDGSLSLSVAAQAQQFCKKQQVTEDEKRELVAELSNCTSREAEKKFAEIAPEVVRSEKFRQVNEETIELRLPVTSELKAKFDRLKECFSHVDPTMSYVDLIDRLADLGLEKHDPIRREARRVARRDKQSAVQVNEETKTQIEVPTNKRNAASTRSCTTASVTQTMKDFIIARDQSCTWIDPNSGRRCDSKMLLQTDHFVPVGVGGKNETENLRALCFAHNQLAAKNWYGEEKMVQYRESARQKK